MAPRAHADRACYKSWVDEHRPSYAVRWARLDDYNRFVDRWPDLQDWFDAPLRQRLLDKETTLHRIQSLLADLGDDRAAPDRRYLGCEQRTTPYSVRRCPTYPSIPTRQHRPKAH